MGWHSAPFPDPVERDEIRAERLMDKLRIDEETMMCLNCTKPTSVDDMLSLSVVPYLIPICGKCFDKEVRKHTTAGAFDRLKEAWSVFWLNLIGKET